MKVQFVIKNYFALKLYVKDYKNVFFKSFEFFAKLFGQLVLGQFQNVNRMWRIRSFKQCI